VLVIILQDYEISSRESFILLSKVRLKNLFLCYLYIIVLIILINDYYRSLHILEQGLLTLFLDENRILNIIRKTLIVAVIENIISFFI